MIPCSLSLILSLSKDAQWCCSGKRALTYLAAAERVAGSLLVLELLQLQLLLEQLLLEIE